MSELLEAKKSSIYSSAAKTPEVLEVQSRLVAANRAAARNILASIVAQYTTEVSRVEKVSREIKA